jgi:hypothetical protein
MHYDVKTYGSGSIAPSFLTSALDGDEWSASRPCRYSSEKRAPGTHWIGVCVDLTIGLSELFIIVITIIIIIIITQ